MCKFIKDLKEKDFGEKCDGGHLSEYRQFETNRINPNLWLSIQASYAHYCTPRTTYRDDLEIYTHWEFALFDKDEFRSVAEVLPEFAALDEIQFYFDGSVYSYVPKDLVEQLYLALK
jgi:hypothetical protein